MAESFKLSSDHTQKATLGVGTLILIALIVSIFSSSGHTVDGGLDDLRRDVQELKKSIEAQSQQIRDLHDAVKNREPAPRQAAEAVPKNPEAIPKNPFELDEPRKKAAP